MDRSDTTKLLALMGEYWPNWRQPADLDQAHLRIQAWQDLLADVSAEVALAAVKCIAIEPGRQFAPAPGEVRMAAMRLLSPDGDIPSPETAWAEVLRAISSRGWTTVLDRCEKGPDCGGRDCDHHEVRFSHPAIQGAADALGWEYLCRSDNQMADRAHFMRFYATAVEAGQRRAAMPPSVVALFGGGTTGPALAPTRPLEVER